MDFNRMQTMDTSTHPDLILYNGRITTLDPKHPEATNLAVKDGRIIGVKDAEEYQSHRICPHHRRRKDCSCDRRIQSARAAADSSTARVVAGESVRRLWRAAG